ALPPGSHPLLPGRLRLPARHRGRRCPRMRLRRPLHRRRPRMVRRRGRAVNIYVLVTSGLLPLAVAGGIFARWLLRREDRREQAREEAETAAWLAVIADEIEHDRHPSAQEGRAGAFAPTATAWPMGGPRADVPGRAERGSPLPQPAASTTEPRAALP